MMQSDRSKSPLQIALEETDLTDLELAYRIGVSATTIWRWRTGRSAPTTHAVCHAIADALRRRPNELFPPGPGSNTWRMTRGSGAPPDDRG